MIPKKKINIVVSGPIGSGKTTISALLDLLLTSQGFDVSVKDNYLGVSQKMGQDIYQESRRILGTWLASNKFEPQQKIHITIRKQGRRRQKGATNATPIHNP